ncbi:MAG: CNNM domain-containing protein [Planctomycetota bacterium]
MSVPLYIPLLMAALLGLSGLFSASETALFSLSPIEARRRSHGITGDALSWCLHNGRSVLVTILLSNLALNTLYFALVGFWAGKAEGLEGVLVAIGSLFILVLFAEIIPKSLALGMSGLLAFWVSPILRVWSILLSPIRFPASLLLNLLASRIASRPRMSSQLGHDEVREIVRQSPERFGLRHRTATVVREIVNLTGLQVREVMQPVVDVRPIAAGSDVSRALRETLERGSEWLAVEQDGVLIGHVDARELLFADPDSGVGRHLHPFVAIPEMARIHHLLHLFRSERVERILVVDEYGDAAGVVSWDDLTENMVGGLVRSEHERGEEPIRPLRGGAWEVSGSLGVREMEDIFGIRLALHRNRTIGGWLVEQLGHLPQAGESIDVQGLEFEVLEAWRGRVEKLVFRNRQPVAPRGPEGRR